MRIPPAALQGITDVDTLVVLQKFDEEPGARLLDVGCNEESLDACVVLARLGYDVTGIDLRPPTKPLPSEVPNFRHLQGDFCELPPGLLASWINSFDAVISISALEHFGLCSTPHERHLQHYADVIAAKLIWYLLKEGGHFYVNTGFGAQYLEDIPHWRVYDDRAFGRRIMQGFSNEGCGYYFAKPAAFDGRVWEAGEVVSTEDARRYFGYPPHLSLFAKLKKEYVRL